MIKTVVVGYGLAGRAFHCPLIVRQSGLVLHGIVARDPARRAEAVATWGTAVRGYTEIDDALRDPDVQLVVIATPHDSHAELVERVLESGRDCVVDKVMALTGAEADRMIAARDRSGRMLSVFHNRRWDWDFSTVRKVISDGSIGRPILIESSVCRFAAPKGWRRQASAAGTILHDWGAHLVDQALMLGFGPCRRLAAWISPGPWDEVDNGGHGRIMLEFDSVRFQVESSRICAIDRPRWWVMGSEGGFLKFGIDPQEAALRAGDIDRAVEPIEHQGAVCRPGADGTIEREVVKTVRSHWDGYYANVAEHLAGRAELAVTAEQAREVVRVLEAAVVAAKENRAEYGEWGSMTEGNSSR
jgi:scyllo-inositol 2-dehydrogenase (NADP+)